MLKSKSEDIFPANSHKIIVSYLANTPKTISF